jgi:hypothetical protein
MTTKTNKVFNSIFSSVIGVWLFVKTAICHNPKKPNHLAFQDSSAFLITHTTRQSILDRGFPSPSHEGFGFIVV